MDPNTENSTESKMGPPHSQGPSDPRQLPELPGKPQPKRAPGGPVIWWLLMVALLIWNLYTFWPETNQRVTIPYTAFLAQVRADNVKKVHLAGNIMTGTFAAPIEWPPAKPAKKANSEASQSKRNPARPILHSSAASRPPGCTESSWSVNFP